MEYQHLYFENNLIQKDIRNLNWISINNNELIVKEISKINE